MYSLIVPFCKRIENVTQPTATVVKGDKRKVKTGAGIKTNGRSM